MEGIVKPRCGSLHKMGEPLAVFLPLTAQLLLPIFLGCFSTGFIETTSIGSLAGSESRVTGLNFQPPSLSTIGSLTGSRSGKRRSRVSLPKVFSAFVNSISFSPELSVFAMFIRNKPTFSSVQGSGL